MCRRWSGGPVFSIGVGAVRFDDETQLERFESSAWAERGFCARCGSSLFYRLKAADQYVMNLGAFLVVIALSSEMDSDNLSHYRGLRARSARNMSG